MSMTRQPVQGQGLWEQRCPMEAHGHRERAAKRPAVRHLSIFLQCESLCAILDLDRSWSRTAKIHQHCMVVALDGAAHCLKTEQGATYNWTKDACSEQEQRQLLTCIGCGSSLT